MDQTLKQRFLEALRSGKYKQGFGKLQCNSCFCATGVLCDLIDPSAWTDTPGAETVKSWRPPGQTKIYEGFPDLVSYPGLAAAITRLIYLNDSMRKSFLEIADEVEKWEMGGILG